MFPKRIESIADVSRRLRIVGGRELHILRTLNPYLALLANSNTEYFEASRTLKSDKHSPLERRVKGEYAGAVLFRRHLPNVEHPYDVTVAMPIRGSHDNRAYAAVDVPFQRIDDQLMAGGEKRSGLLAHQIAAEGIYGYLTGDLPELPIRVPERTEHLLTHLMRNL